MLEIKNMSKVYKDKKILDNINIKFEYGRYGLFSNNRGGKSTFIKIISRISNPTNGTITYNNKNIFDMGNEYKDLVGYAPQDLGYYRNYTLIKFLMYISVIKGIDTKEANDIIESNIDLFELRDVLNTRLKYFTRGMIKKVNILQALLNKPKIILLDEIIDGLNIKDKIKIRNILDHISRDNIIIFSTSNVYDIELLSNRVIVIKDNEIIYNDYIDEICNSMHGMIFEAEVDRENIQKYRNKYLVLSEYFNGNNINVRFVRKGEYNKDWYLIYPSFTDIISYEFRDIII